MHGTTVRISFNNLQYTRFWWPYDIDVKSALSHTSVLPACFSCLHAFWSTFFEDYVGLMLTLFYTLWTTEIINNIWNISESQGCEVILANRVEEGYSIHILWTFHWMFPYPCMTLDNVFQRMLSRNGSKTPTICIAAKAIKSGGSTLRFSGRNYLKMQYLERHQTSNCCRNKILHKVPSRKHPLSVIILVYSQPCSSLS